MSPTEDPKKRSKYRPIADALRDAIQRGEYAPGDRIPGENALMAKYGVTRPTARLALDVLKNEGLVAARKGSGTVVRDFKPLRRHGIQRLAEEQWGSGRSIWDADTDGRSLDVDNIRVQEGTAPAHVAHVLGLGPDEPVIVRSRRFVLDGKPVLAATSYLPAGIAAGTPIADPNPGDGGIYKRLAELGFAPTRFVEEIRSRMPLPDEVEDLDLPVGTPVFLLCRVAFAADRVPVEVNEMVLDAMAYVLNYEFDA